MPRAILERTVARNRLIPHTPTARQLKFLELECLDALYGGAAGGGKSDALLMAAVQFAEVPGYSALLLRRTFADLKLPGALLDRSHAWFRPHARWHAQEHRWRFRHGSTLQFGYCETEKDVYRYQSSEFQFVGLDEATQFTEHQVRYLFSRLRRRVEIPVPLRFRLASNPGNVGHEFVKSRYITRPEGRAFVSANLADNPHLNRAEYVRSLQELDPVTRAQLLAGDWDAYAGGRFRPEWFRTYRPFGQFRHGRVPDAWRLGERLVLSAECQVFVTLDPAATAKDTSDYTAIGAFALTPDRDLLVLEVVRERLPLDGIVPRLAEVCGRWRPSWCGLEAVGFQAGLVTEARRHPEIDAVVVELHPEGRDKLVRATPAILLAEQGGLYLPESAPWRADFVAELQQFTGDAKQDAHDDQVDVLAYAALARRYHYVGATDQPTVVDRAAATWPTPPPR